MLRGRPDGVVVNTSALESRGRGFKSRSGQFLGFSLYVYIYIYKLMRLTDEWTNSVLVYETDLY